MKIGDTIKLIPKTRHGKNRVHEHGDIGTISIIRSASFLSKAPDKYWRWIDITEDEDFDWEIL